MPAPHEVLQIFLRQRPSLIRYAMTLVGSRAEAEDILQEAWMKFQASARVRALDAPEGYLRRIVRNLVLDNRRRHALERRLFLEDSDGAKEAVPADAPSPLASAEARDELAIVQAAVAAMPERMRIAFEMHRFQGARLVDIAAHLSISKSLAQELVVEGVERCKKALRNGP